MFKKHGNLKKILLFSAFWAFVTILACLCYSRHFFNTDDAINGYLGYYAQYGRVWSQGQIPLMLDSLFFGGNAAVELEYAAYSPQAILASLLAWHMGQKHVVGIFLAFFNIALVCASCVIIGKAFNLRDRFAYALGAFCAIQPVFLFIYCRSWWNAAAGQAWCFAAIGTFLLLARKTSARNFFLNFVSVFFLLLCVWTHSIIAYMLFVLIFIPAYLKKGNFYAAFILLAANVLAGVTAILFYTEYVYTADLHNRFSMIINHNFLTPPLMSIVLGFIPSFYDYINWYGGYRFMALPLAFSNIFLPLALFFRKFNTLIHNSYDLRIILFLTLIMFLLTQMPETFLSMRYTFRFLPLLAFFLCLSIFYIINKATPCKNFLKYFFIFIGACLFISFSREAGHGNFLRLLQFFSCLLIILLCFLDRFPLTLQKGAFIFGALAALIIILIGFNKNNVEYLWAPVLPRNIAIPDDLNLEGFYLRAQQQDPQSSSWLYLFGGRAGIFNIRSINGYTALGYKKAGFLPFAIPHDNSSPQKALDRLLSKVPGLEMCRAEEWRISSMGMPKAVEEQNRQKLAECGYGPASEPLEGFVYVSQPKEKTKGWESLPPVAIPPLPGMKSLGHGDSFDEIWLPERSEPVRLIFPRQYWHGYRATFNGEKLKVSPDDAGMLVQAEVPAGPAGTLELSYFPVTWSWLWPLPLLGFCGMLFGCLWLRKHKIPHFWRPENMTNRA